jgi:hypothetical protein
MKDDELFVIPAWLHPVLVVRMVPKDATPGFGACRYFTVGDMAV